MGNHDGILAEVHMAYAPATELTSEVGDSQSLNNDNFDHETEDVAGEQGDRSLKGIANRIHARNLRTHTKAKHAQPNALKWP